MASEASVRASERPRLASERPSVRASESNFLLANVRAFDFILPQPIFDMWFTLLLATSVWGSNINYNGFCECDCTSCPSQSVSTSTCNSLQLHTIFFLPWVCTGFGTSAVWTCDTRQPSCEAWNLTCTNACTSMGNGCEVGVGGGSLSSCGAETNDDDYKPPEPGGLSLGGGAIAGIVIGILILVLAVGGFAGYKFYKRRQYNSLTSEPLIGSK